MKKGTRRCSVFGFFLTHNVRPCPLLEHNGEHLEAMRSRNRERGKPPCAKNKNSAMCESVEHGHDIRPVTRRQVMTNNMYSEWDSYS